MTVTPNTEADLRLTVKHATHMRGNLMNVLPSQDDVKARARVIWAHADLLRAIAYTNVLHLCSGDPDQWISENPETWNHQLNYAEIIVDALHANGRIAVRGAWK